MYRFNLKTLEKMKNNEPLRIVCFGDSITYGYQVGTKEQVARPYPLVLEEELHKHGVKAQVINSGKSGWRTKNSLDYIQELVHDHEPDVCIIMLGINDARGSFKGITLSKRRYERNMRKILASLTNENIDVFVLSPTPTNNRRVNRFSKYLIEQLVLSNLKYVNMYRRVEEKIQEENLKFEEVFPDGVHFADQYYEWIAQILIEEYLDVSLTMVETLPVKKKDE